MEQTLKLLIVVNKDLGKIRMPSSQVEIKNSLSYYNVFFKVHRSFQFKKNNRNIEGRK